MSYSMTDESVTITLPAIPYLSTYPFSVTLPLSSLRTLLRLVVAVATLLLFRPHLQRLFRATMGLDDPDVPQSVEGMKHKMKTLEGKRGEPIGGGRKVAVATTSGSANIVGQGQKTRRKA